MSKIKVKDIYALPSTLLDLTQTMLKSRWVPELSYLIHDFGTEVSAAIVGEGRFVIKSLVDETYDDRRYSQMCSIWFDGKPVLIFQEAGRSGRDHFKRWLTDKVAYAEMLSYLIEKLSDEPETELDDLIDPDTEVYPEELLCFYGNSHLQQFGIETEPAMEGVSILQNERGLLAGVPRDEYLIFLRDFVQDIPEYIRRQGFVLQKIRLIPTEEISASNPRILEVTKANGEDRVFLYQKATAPDGTYVQPV